jgi:hypothetical protein
MTDVLAGVLSTLTFVLFLSVWNLISKGLPGANTGGLNWVIFLMAAIVAIVVYMQTSNGRGGL